MELQKVFLPGGRGRPGIVRGATKAVVVHTPDVAKQRAREIRNYWMSAANVARASTHAIVDLDGVVVQTLPWDEKGFHAGSIKLDPASGRIYTELARELFGNFADGSTSRSPNDLSVGFEMTQVDADGRISDVVRDASVELAAMLLSMYRLGVDCLVRHFDVVGYKRCPRYFANDDRAFKDFRALVAKALA